MVRDFDKKNKDWEYWCGFHFAKDIMSSIEWLGVIFGTVVFLGLSCLWVFNEMGVYYYRTYALPVSIFVFSIVFILYISADMDESQ